MPPCLTLSIIRYISRVKWSTPGKGVVPFPTPHSYRKGNLWVTLDYSCQLTTYKLFVYPQFKCQTILFDPLIEPYQVLLLRVRVDQKGIATKGHSAFLKAQDWSLTIRLFSVISGHSLEKRVLFFCRDTVEVLISVFANGQVDQGSIPGWVIPKTQKMVLDATLLNTQHCEDHESTRCAGANNVILPPENVNRMMGLWIRFTPTVFMSPLLTISILETFLASQEFSGSRVIR